MKSGIIINILLLISVCGTAGTVSNDTIHKKRNFPALVLAYQSGNIIQTTDFVRGENKAGKPLTLYQSYGLRFVYQNPGYKQWQRIYHAPYYGGGISLSNFHDTAEIGNPVSAYGVLGIPVFRINKLQLYTEIQFGMTGNWKHYDPETNPYNTVIGGGHTVHLDIGTNLTYSLCDKLDFGLGASFIHFSNGGFERPNRGFNIWSPTFSLKYLPNGHPDFNYIPKPEKQPRKGMLYLMAGYGDHQLVEHEFDTNYYAVGGLSAIYFRQFSNAFRLGAGIDFNYFMGLTAKPDGTIGPKNFDNLTAGIILQPEFIIDRLTLTGGIGFYARHLHYGEYKMLYQRLGVNYEIYKGISLGVNIRAIHFMLAEFLEFNLGYRIRWN